MNADGSSGKRIRDTRSVPAGEAALLASSPEAAGEMSVPCNYLISHINRFASILVKFQHYDTIVIDYDDKASTFIFIRRPADLHSGLHRDPRCNGL